MKYLILNIIMCIMILGCNTNKYYGYVYDFKTEKPLINVDIKDSITNTKTRTNSIGYFNIEINSKSGIILLFQKKDTKPKLLRM